mgnify:CR=1 FL=1
MFIYPIAIRADLSTAILILIERPARFLHEGSPAGRALGRGNLHTLEVFHQGGEWMPHPWEAPIRT